MDNIYEDFITKVASGRGMKKAEVDSIGQGRVWAGKDAIEIGLVDEYGGMQDAIHDAVERAGVEDVAIKYYPEGQGSELLELIDALESQEISMDVRSQLENQMIEIYEYLKTVGTTQQIQARLPYLYWIE